MTKSLLIKTSATLILILTFVAGLFWFFHDSTPRFNSSNVPAYIPQTGDSFEFYLQENRSRIRHALEEYYFKEQEQPFGADYTLEQVLRMRSPFQLQADESRCGEAERKEQGFLLVHGLSDSPYLLSEVAATLQQTFPCSLIRALLSPGHGTIPGDLKAIKLDDWEKTFAWGVEGFQDKVDSLYVVGYSNGVPLALQYLDQHRNSDFIAGLVALSPGLKPLDGRSFLAPYIKYFMGWVNRDADTDAVKYESFPMNATAQFYRLTSKILSTRFEPLTTPVFMVTSGDDTTVDNQITVDFFCNKFSASDKRLIWYQSAIRPTVPEKSCADVELQKAPAEPAQFISFSHVGITMPMDNPHYGINGYPLCLGYVDSPEDLNECQTNDDHVVYAEKNFRDEESGRYEGKLVRRATFNPLFDDMMADVVCFVKSQCELDPISP